jgi:hypothetical protein
MDVHLIIFFDPLRPTNYSSFLDTLIDSVMVVKITGQQLLYALENGVSKYPAKEG